MRHRLFFPCLFFLSIQAFSQNDLKWSIEANYPLSIGDQIGNDNNPIIDLGLKYRFVDFNIVKLGFGINTSVFNKSVSSSGGPQTDFEETNFFIQPKLFGEFDIPAISRLHPSVGLGYTVVRSKYEGFFIGENVSGTESDGGINLNLGLSYDLTKSLFIQAQYDYFNQRVENEDLGLKGTKNIGLLKFGAGLRF